MSELLTLNRMAHKLGVTSTWLKRQAESGKVPCLKADKKYLFNADAVIKILTAEAATLEEVTA